MPCRLTIVMFQCLVSRDFVATSGKLETLLCCLNSGALHKYLACCFHGQIQTCITEYGVHFVDVLCSSGGSARQYKDRGTCQIS